MMRLDKMLSHLNYGTRKEVKAFIRKGLVSVNGNVILDDDFKVDEKQDEIFFLNEKIHYEEFIYLILNKPKGVVSATFDETETTVLDLIDGFEGRDLFPVGRLDKDTTGLLLLTNDGKLAHELLSPAKHVSKTYEAVFSGHYKDELPMLFQKGIMLEDGTICLPAQLERIDSHKARIIIEEGKYHQVKRMFLAVGLEVLELKRIAFGELWLPDDLKEGMYRPLTALEKKLLQEKK